MKKLFISLFLAYLRLAARIQLAKIRPKIVGLTGSVGKTSLRNAITAVLQEKYEVKQSVKANSETGIPLDLLRLHPRDYSFKDWLRLILMVPVKLLTNWQQYDVYVVELGIDDPFPPKNMEYLLRFIKPDIGVFLNVAPVHTEQFSKAIPMKPKLTFQQKKKLILKAIAQEKGRLITQLSADKIAVVNQDDLLVRKQGQKTQAKIIPFGKKAKQGILIGKVTYQFGKKRYCQPQDVTTTLTFRLQSQTYFLVLPLLVPDYYASTLAAALTVGAQMGITIEKGLVSLGERFVLPPGRMNLFAGKKRSLLIDSSYNASKKSTLGALVLLNNIPQKPKIVVLGDMRELGEMAEAEHTEVAKEIVQVADEVVLIGNLTQKYVLPIVKKRLPTRWFSTSWQAADYLKRNLKEGAVVLVKGSQNTIFTEIVVEKLLKNPRNTQNLCRRGKFWDRQRTMLRST